MRKWLLWILCSILLYSFCACKPTINNEEQPNDTPTEITYSIQYKCLVAGQQQDLFEVMKIPTGTYPTTYKKGQDAYISNLQSYCTAENITYRFDGWYYNEVCTEKLINNKISKDKVGDIVLYANITVLRPEADDNAIEYVCLV